MIGKRVLTLKQENLVSYFALCIWDKSIWTIIIHYVYAKICFGEYRENVTHDYYYNEIYRYILFYMDKCIYTNVCILHLFFLMMANRVVCEFFHVCNSQSVNYSIIVQKSFYYLQWFACTLLRAKAFNLVTTDLSNESVKAASERGSSKTLHIKTWVSHKRPTASLRSRLSRTLVKRLAKQLLAGPRRVILGRQYRSDYRLDSMQVKNALVHRV